MRMIGITLLAIAASGCAALKDPIIEQSNTRIIGNSEAVTRIHIEQMNIIQRDGDVSDVAAKITETSAPIADLYSFCQDLTRNRYHFRLYSNCMDFYRLAVSEQAEMTIGLGKHYLKKGMTDKARETFRGIVTTFTGDAYRSYVKMAEFALEDMKEKK